MAKSSILVNQALLKEVLFTSIYVTSFQGRWNCNSHATCCDLMRVAAQCLQIVAVTARCKKASSDVHASELRCACEQVERCMRVKFEFPSGKSDLGGSGRYSKGLKALKL